jgi:hypothetical protein
MRAERTLPEVYKVMVAIWRPDPELPRLVGDDVVVRRALLDQGRYGDGEPFDALLAATVEDPRGPGPDTTLVLASTTYRGGM